MSSQCWVSCQISEKVLQEHLNFGLFVFDLFSCIRLASLRFTIFSVRFYLMARNRGQSAADVADATRAAFHLTASAHPTKIKHQKMSELPFTKALDR